MNNRIIELAKMAKVIGNSENDISPPMREFAELIIQGCIMQTLSEGFIEMECDAPYYEENLKKHFGVE
jgi:hypothetical protein